MKPLHFQSLSVFTVFFAILSHEVSTFRIEEEILGDDADDGINQSSRGQRRLLTPQEEALADQARTQIAKTIENNLIRIFAVIVSQEEESPYLRQDNEDDESDVGITPNPNVLPQVAQILGAIFSGNLNITRIVDNTVGLVPNLVRTQIQGLVKLLTGENVNLSGTTTVTPPKIVDNTNTEFEIIESEPETTVTAVTQAAEVTASSPVPEPSTALPVITTEKGRYRVRNKTRRVTSTPSPLSLGDDEIDRLERELRDAGHLLEPYEQNKEPRFYAGLFDTVMKNVNMTQVAQAVPSIFKGATQAFTLLENLGVLDTLPGADVLEDLDTDLGLDE